jgi:hypothetical protein
MSTVLTLCASNYLAHAKVLGQSLTEHNPHIRFVIGLVDRLPAGLGEKFWAPFELIPVEQLQIPGFWEMARKYNVVELNTAVKPFYIEHLYQRDEAESRIIYFDPDILVFGSLAQLEEKLRTFNFVLTPHSCTYDDSSTNLYYEIGMLKTGIYNLGFLGTSRSDNTFKFLRWWRHRVQEFCFYQPGSGVFTDQLWVTLAPLYFPGFYIEKDPGYNMCYWNHFERQLSRNGSKYKVNREHDLVFYHFSSYSPRQPNSITARARSRVQTFSERPDLKLIYEEYCARLLTAGYSTVENLAFSMPREASQTSFSIKMAAKQAVRSLVGALPKRSQTALKNLALFTAQDCLRDTK